jgi:hypothetical protein
MAQQETDVWAASARAGLLSFDVCFVYAVESGRLNWVRVDIVNFCACIILANHVTSYEVLSQCSRATPRLLLLFLVALFLCQPTL